MSRREWTQAIHHYRCTPHGARHHPRLFLPMITTIRLVPFKSCYQIPHRLDTLQECGICGRTAAGVHAVPISASRFTVSTARIQQPHSHHHHPWSRLLALRKTAFASSFTKRVLCSTAIEADEKAVLAFKKRATAHSGMGDYHAAQRDLAAALQLEPGSVGTHLQRWD